MMEGDIVQNTLVLYAGKQGVGKTMMARALAPNANYAADDFGQYDEQGNYLKEKATAAHAECLHQTELAMICGEKFIAVHNIFRTERQRIDYLIKARIHGYVVLVFEGHGGVYPDGHPTKNVHNVPQEVVDSFEWEPHQPPIEVEELEVQVLAYAMPHNVQSSQVWEWVRAMARNEWSAVPSEIRKDAKFWRLVNSFRYWNETQQHFAWELVRTEYGVLFEDLHETFLKFWETGDFYKMSIDDIATNFHAYTGQVLGLVKL